MPRINIEKTADKLTREIGLYLAFFAITREEVVEPACLRESDHANGGLVLRSKRA